MKKQTPPMIPLWSQDNQGRLTAKRDAQFWHTLPNGRVACDLCYRRCELAPGETGWCDYRPLCVLCEWESGVAAGQAPVGLWRASGGPLGWLARQPRNGAPGQRRCDRAAVGLYAGRI